MTLEYRERATLGSGWSLEVCSSGVLVGHIRFGANNLFRYYSSSEKDLTPLLSDSDLETLQRKVGDHRHPSAGEPQEQIVVHTPAALV